MFLGISTFIVDLNVAWFRLLCRFFSSPTILEEWRQEENHAIQDEECLVACTDSHTDVWQLKEILFVELIFDHTQNAAGIEGF